MPNITNGVPSNNGTVLQQRQPPRRTYGQRRQPDAGQPTAVADPPPPPTAVVHPLDAPGPDSEYAAPPPPPPSHEQIDRPRRRASLGRPPLKDTEKEWMFIGLIRREWLFQRAVASLQLEYFTEYEQWLRLIWMLTTQHFQDYAELPTIGFLKQLCNEAMELDPGCVPEGEDGKLSEFLQLAAVVKEDDLPDRVILSSLQKFLEDRLLYVARRKFSEPMVPHAVPDMIANLYHDAVEITAIAHNDDTSFGRLRQQNPNLRRVVIDGIARTSDLINLISTAKAGKSWLAGQLAICKIAGIPFLSQFRMPRGRVLLIDNELDPTDIAWRIGQIADALGVPIDLVDQNLTIWALRGQPSGLKDLQSRLAAVRRGQFDLVIVDSLYGLFDDGIEENDNSAVARFFRRIRAELAVRLDATVLLVHHATKGSQGEKRTVDVGAGASAMARACDAHIIIREHADEADVGVLDAVVRTFPAVQPMSLRWRFPVWVADAGIAPAVKGRKESQAGNDQKGREEILQALASGPATRSELRTCTSGMGDIRIKRLLSQLQAARQVMERPACRNNKECTEFVLVSEGQP